MPVTTTAKQDDSAELARLRAGLTEMLTQHKGTPCCFWACPGMTGEIVPMATCAVCAMQIEITTLLGATSTSEHGGQT